MKNYITICFDKRSKIIVYVSLIIICIGNIITKKVNLMTYIFLLLPLVYKFLYEISHSQKRIISFMVYTIPLFLIFIYYMLYAFFEKFRYFTQSIDSILISVNVRKIFTSISNNTIIYTLSLFAFVLVLNLIEKFVRNNDLACIITVSIFLFYSIFFLIVT